LTNSHSRAKISPGESTLPFDRFLVISLITRKLSVQDIESDENPAGATQPGIFCKVLCSSECRKVFKDNSAEN
jgi:hypothetical protein